MIEIHNKSLVRAINIQLDIMCRSKFYDEHIYITEDINSIKCINLINPDSIDEIDKLVNLETLNIGYSNCFDLDKYITDFEIISKLGNLKSFTLINNIRLEKLDLSKLISLEKLKLIYNPFLTNITGLDQLTNLQDVMIVGNNIDTINNFEDFIKNNKNLEKTLLDIFLYPSLVKYFKNDSINNKIMFAEKISFGEIYKTDIKTMNKVHNIATNIVTNETNNDLENSIINIYRYIVTHLTYDYDGLEERNNYYINNKYNPFLENELMNKFKLMNTCIHALLNGCVVCEAYVNALIYLYNLIEIKARSLRVREKGSNTHYDHATMCFLYNNKIYYSDPQKEDDFIKLNKLFMSEEEFKSIYDISPLDELIINNWKEELNDKITRSFERTK